MLYEVLRAARSHPTADELFQLAAGRDGLEPGELSLATVYNTLDAFAEAGLCRRIACPGGAARFDGEMCDHIHVVMADGRLVDLPEDLSRRLLGAISPGLMAEIEHRFGGSVASLSVQISADGRGR